MTNDDKLFVKFFSSREKFIEFSRLSKEAAGHQWDCVRDNFLLAVSPHLTWNQTKEVCLWALSDDENNVFWTTMCGEDFTFIDGTPQENGMIFCHHCGRKISYHPVKTGRKP